MESRTWIISRLSREHERKSFQCGEPALDTYLHKYAKQDSQKGFASVFVATHENDPHRVTGYYTISAASVLLDRLPPEQVCHLPRYPEVPCILLGRLAVAKEFQGHHLGYYLLYDGLQRAAKNELAWAIFLVQAKTEQVRQFYTKFGFTSFADNTLYLWMTRKHVESIIENNA